MKTLMPMPSSPPPLPSLMPKRMKRMTCLWLCESRNRPVGAEDVSDHVRCRHLLGLQHLHRHRHRFRAMTASSDSTTVSLWRPTSGTTATPCTRAAYVDSRSRIPWLFVVTSYTMVKLRDQEQAAVAPGLPAATWTPLGASLVSGAPAAAPGRLRRSHVGCVMKR